MSYNRNSNPDDACDFVRVCRLIPQCHRMEIPGACATCESLNPEPPRDEDGDLIVIPDNPQSPTR